MEWLCTVPYNIFVSKMKSKNRSERCNWDTTIVIWLSHTLDCMRFPTFLLVVWKVNIMISNLICIHPETKNRDSRHLILLLFKSDKVVCLFSEAIQNRFFTLKMLKLTPPCPKTLHSNMPTNLRNIIALHYWILPLGQGLAPSDVCLSSKFKTPCTNFLTKALLHISLILGPS